MEERGQKTLESVLIGVTSVAIVVVSLAVFKAGCPGQWENWSVAVSDVSRDVAWRADTYVEDWKNGVAWNRTQAVLDGDPNAVSLAAHIRPATSDPLAEIRALR